jgi:hypothetical protein
MFVGVQCEHFFPNHRLLADVRLTRPVRYCEWLVNLRLPNIFQQNTMHQGSPQELRNSTYIRVPSCRPGYGETNIGPARGSIRFALVDSFAMLFQSTTSIWSGGVLWCCVL